MLLYVMFEWHVAYLWTTQPSWWEVIDSEWVSCSMVTALEVCVGVKRVMVTVCVGVSEWWCECVLVWVSDGVNEWVWWCEWVWCDCLVNSANVMICDGVSEHLWGEWVSRWCEWCVVSEWWYIAVVGAIHTLQLGCCMFSLWNEWHHFPIVLIWYFL